MAKGMPSGIELLKTMYNENPLPRPDNLRPYHCRPLLAVEGGNLAVEIKKGIESVPSLSP